MSPWCFITVTTQNCLFVCFLVHFFQQPEDITVQENEIVNITCFYNGTTRPPIWIINGMTYTLLQLIQNPTYHLSGPYSIYFESTYILQSASYQCTVIDEDQTYNSQIGYLTVGEPENSFMLFSDDMIYISAY